MEAVFTNKNLPHELSLKKMMDAFFKVNNPDSIREIFFKLFQCWVTKDCNNKAEITDKELATFFDQITDFFTVAYDLYSKSNLTNADQERKGND